jgi:sirohydrochlorin cobaltochelatase
MKHLRHFTRGTAIILSCFGSVVNQHKYLALKQQIAMRFPDADVLLATSSRTVLKLLTKQYAEKNAGATATNGAEEMQFATLAQQLAYADRCGYKQICVVSGYLFPTDEHQRMVQVVEAFKQISFANITYTPAILQNSLKSSHVINALQQRIGDSQQQLNLYIYHGAPDLANSGFHSIWYLTSLLEQLSPNNRVCSLEGAHPYKIISPALKRELIQYKRIKIVLLLLVSGNHFDNDIAAIADELSTLVEVDVMAPISGDRWYLIDFEPVIENVLEQCNNSLLRLDALCPHALD